LVEAKQWHSIGLNQVFGKIDSSENGLVSEEAEKRIQVHGFNELKEAKHRGPVQIFFGQFANFLILLLIAAALVSGFLQEWLDAGAILAIVVLNAVFGFVQEYRAEKAIQALKQMVAPQAKALRGGKTVLVPARELVPGDIIFLEAGDKVPADARLIEAPHLEVDEASLTGESVPVAKNAAAVCRQEATIGDKENLVFLGTVVSSGRAKAVVVETGMNTEIGRIAELVQEVGEEETPLKIKLEKLGKQLGLIVLAIVAVVFLVGVGRGIELINMFLTSVSLAVAAVPEGLPAVVTITLAIGVQRMARRNAVVRKLPAVETLGAATVICTDKTGTLTRNEMTVTKIFANNAFYSVSGAGYSFKGEFFDERDRKLVDFKNLELVAGTSALCNNASLSEEEGKVRVVGDPTEAALMVLARKAGISKEELVKEMKFVDELSFDSARKMMSVIYEEKKSSKQLLVFSKGAPEVVLKKCSKILLEGKEKSLGPGDKKKLLEQNSLMASQALRVLALAYRRMPKKMPQYTAENVEKELVFIALVGMMDTPREEVRAALEKCRQAGINVVMITGDNKETAVAVGKEIGLIGSGEWKAVTGEELNEFGDDELEREVESIKIYARVSPEHKLRIVEAWRKKGHIVAVTGDGVNDAPALKKSDIGVAMGITGTDVAKEASNMVLADDNFASIVNAVEEGRTIYNNIGKTVNFLLSCNIGEVLVIFLAIIIGFPLPLIPIQILWMNFVTDGLPALALGMDSTDSEAMKKPPRNPKEEILNRKKMVKLLAIAVLMTAATLGIYWFYLDRGEIVARTMAFNTLIVSQLFIALYWHAGEKQVHEVGFGKNRMLLLAIGVGLALQLAVTHVAFAQKIFETTAISALEWGVVLAASAAVLVASELKKLVWPNPATT
jgi:Ca2+-transporting ATPase